MSDPVRVPLIVESSDPVKFLADVTGTSFTGVTVRVTVDVFPDAVPSKDV